MVDAAFSMRPVLNYHRYIAVGCNRIKIVDKYIFEVKNLFCRILIHYVLINIASLHIGQINFICNIGKKWNHNSSLSMYGKFCLGPIARPQLGACLSHSEATACWHSPLIIAHTVHTSIILHV